MTPYFSHQGWDVFWWEDDDGDVIKTLYEARNQDTGDRQEIDISPYGFTHVSLIKRIIDLGFPGRVGPSPLTHSDLDQLSPPPLIEAAE